MEVHFLGIEFTDREVTAVIIAKGGEVVASRSRRFARTEESAPGRLVDPRDWTGAAGTAVREIVATSGIPLRKIWGLGLTGPDGFVAVDRDLKPLGPVHIAGGREDVVQAFIRWLEEEPSRRRFTSLVLGPKDLLRLAWSGGVATDVTNADGMGLLAPGRLDWHLSRLRALGLDPRWFPPVFDSFHRTGQLSRDGMEQSGLRDGTWVVAGARNRPASMVASGDLRGEKRYIEAGSNPTIAWIREGGRRYAMPGIAYHELPLEDVSDPAWHGTTAIIDHREGESPEAAAEWALSRRMEVELSPYAGGPGAGGAILAAIGSGAYPSFDSLYRKAIRPLPWGRQVPEET